jgi:ribosomal protein L21
MYENDKGSAMTTKLSDNQRMLMNGFNADPKPFSFWDGGFVAHDSGTWESTFITEVAHIIGKPESSAKRTIHDLVKKGIFTSLEHEAEPGIPIMEGDDVVGEVEGSGRDADAWIELTDSGVELIADLRLEEDEAMLDMDMEDEDDDEPQMQTKSIAGLEADKRIKEARAKQNKELKGAAQEDIKAGKPGLRTSHADCNHATHGKEGKIARAKCRRERAAKAAAEEKANA